MPLNFRTTKSDLDSAAVVTTAMRKNGVAVWGVAFGNAGASHDLATLTGSIIGTLGYNAEILPNKTLGYQFIADFVNPKEMPQLGSQGNVEIYGNRVPFIYYILRRPIQSSRRLFGI